MADAGPLGDLVDARAQALLGENLGRGVEHAAEVALSICSERRAHVYAALAKTGSSDLASASMRATSLARSRVSSTTSAASTITAAPP